MNRKAKFTQADVTRAVKGAVQGGLPISRVEVDQDGRIIILAGSPKKLDACNEWDEVLQ